MSPAERPAGPLGRFFFSGFAPESLGLLRQWLGATLVVYAAYQFGSTLIFDPLGPGFYYLEPIWYFSALGIEHNVPLLNLALFAALLAAGVAVVRGQYTRTALLVMLLSILYLKGVRDSIAGDVHHRLLIPFHLLLLLFFSRCGDVLSRDAGSPASQARGPLEVWEASWPIKAMQVYCAFFYFFGAVAKLRASGIAWFGPERIQSLLISRSVGRGFEEGDWSFKALSWEMAQSPELCAMLGFLTLVFEIGFPVVLFFKDARLRFLILAGASLFHFSNFLLADVEFLLMPLMFVIFFDMRVVRDALRPAKRLTRADPFE